MKNGVKQVYNSISTGLFIVGYVIGTGSVTSMIVAGARYGMSLTWALLLSCFFTFIMLLAIGELTLVTGHTIIYNIKKNIGKGAALLLIIGLLVTMVASISGVMGIMVEVTSEWMKWMNWQSGNTLAIALIFLILLLIIFWTGKHRTILLFMTMMVGLMALNFIITNFLIVQNPRQILEGMIPSIPDSGEPHLIIAGIVGTTMAAVVLVSRSTLVAERGWTHNELKKERKDALIAMIVTFLVSAAIMASAAGTLHVMGIRVDNAIDMMHALKPLVGDLAILILLIGIIAAGLSSIFPNMVLFPWLISDYRHENRNLKSKRNRILVIIISLSGLLVPVFGGKPIVIMIASQAISPLLMPLLIVFLIVLLNSKKVMGKNVTSNSMNIMLGTTLVFSLYMLYVSMKGFLDLIL